jgi:hypothetical protein
MARHNIPEDRGNGRTKAVDVIIDDAFDVTPESIPSGLPGTPDGGPINWVSNFRVTKKPGRPNTGKKVKYSIELDSVPGDLYYYDASSTSAILLTKRNVGKNRIQADLSVDDPPIGHT